MYPDPFQFWPANERANNKRQAIYFAHANAYPPASYQAIIDGLRDIAPVVSYLQRPLWPEPPPLSSVKSWHDFADDVIHFFEQENMSNVMVVGHSMGAVSAFLAATKRPDLIKALVMIEPVVFSRGFCWLNRILPKFLLEQVPIIKKTLHRPDHWPSLQAAFDFHRRTRAFKRVDDEQLWQFIRAGVKADNQGGYQLVFDKHWEAHIYQTVTPFRKQLMQSTLPVLALRGAETDTIPAAFWRCWHKNTHHQLIEIPNSSHLLPLERPEQVLAQALPFIEHHR
ncbi:MAG: alpha/beta fold hydrolase [Proteobacteria bacterium]|nr:alpha/beta fold hydrolase [Pseudomonadota bacterium]